MPDDLERQKADLIKKATAESRKRLTKTARNRFKGFLSDYYRNVPPQDIADNNPGTLFSLAQGHWKLGAIRPPRKSLVRVFNPDQRKDGWVSEHTIIEIINDDMPFLVDSVTAEVNRQDLTVHLVIHPILNVRRNKAGKFLETVKGGGSKNKTLAESFMHLQVTHLSGNRLKDIERGIKSVLRDVRVAVRD